MKFRSLSFENFLSFRTKQTVPLADLGLVLVRGENRISEAADSNGSGKSALFSALSWVLYGETLPGPDGKVLRVDEVACRFTKEPCEVRLEMTDQTGVWAVERGRRPAFVRLLKSGSVVEVTDAREFQVKVDQLVGFGPATFRNAVVFGQGTFERFAQADQSVQMKMLDEIQGCDFRAALDRAKAWRDEWNRKLNALIGDATVLVSRKAGAERVREELISARMQFRDGKASRVKEAEIRVKAAEAAVADATQRVNDREREAAGAKGLAEKWARLQDLERQVADVARDLEREKDKVDQARDAVEERCGAVDALVQEGRCPTCRRAIEGKAEIAKVRKAFAPDLKATQDALAEADSRSSGVAHAYKECVAVLERHKKAVPGLTVDVVAKAQVAERTLAEGRQAAEGEQERLLVARTVLTTERGARWEGEAVLAAAEKEIADAEEGLKRNGDEQAKAQRTIAAAEYWVEAFGDRGLRSLLFDSVAGFLNERVVAHLEVLTAGEAQVEVSAQTALKSGAMKEKLSIGASWAWGAGSYAAGSAGQDRRIDLALFAALQDLAESRSARPFPLRIYDEPFDALDSRGKEVSVSWVRRETIKRGTVFLVTHSEELAGMTNPDQVWTVVLDRDGSRVEVS